jgi:hypothetical protein
MTSNGWGLSNPLCASPIHPLTRTDNHIFPFYFAESAKLRLSGVSAQNPVNERYCNYRQSNSVPFGIIIARTNAIELGFEAGALRDRSSCRRRRDGRGVSRARDSALGRDVAVKVLPAAFSEDSDRLRRFKQEAQAAAALNHPNILTIFHVGDYNGAPYIVSELLEGESLRQRLLTGPMPVRKAIDYAVQVARGLAAAHDKGIVHRDLKAENIFLVRDGRAKFWISVWPS